MGNDSALVSLWLSPFRNSIFDLSTFTAETEGFGEREDKREENRIRIRIGKLKFSTI